MFYAPPVTRDGFFHSGDSFYVEVDHNRHTRCSSTELYALITYTDPGPVLTKAGKVAKKQPSPHKDRALHFYEAQCLHYGIKPYKTRPAAKKHLLAAFDIDATTKALKVPSHIIALEKALEEEYRVANEAATRKAKEEYVHQEQQRKVLQQQREIEYEKERKRKAEEANAMIKEFAAAGIVIAKGTVPDAKGRPRANVPVSDAQLRKDLTSLPEAQLRALVEKLVFDKRNPSSKKTALQEIATIKKEQAAKALESSKSKAKGKIKVELLCDTQDNMGEYIVMAPYLRENWDRQYTDMDTMSLKMSASPSQSHLWVSFNFGIISGIMRSYNAPPKHVGDTAEFHWKGREEGTGETCYGDENVVSITFLGNGRIRGRMFCPFAGTFELIGKKVARPNVVWSKNVDEWKSEYRGINERSYEAENVGRWGGWCDPGSEGDMTPNSDTGTEDHDEDHDESGLEDDIHDVDEYAF